MTGTVWVFLAIAVALVGLRTIQLMALLVHMLRVPLWPTTVSAGEEAVDLDGCDETAVAELEALEFCRLSWGWAQSGPVRSRHLLFRHETEPAWARMGLFPNPYAGYQLSFVSFRPDGAMLVTGNREALSVDFALGAGVEGADAFADCLRAHWEAHLARMRLSEVASMTDAEAHRRLDGLAEGIFDRLRETGRIARVGEHWHFTVKTAARLAWGLLRRRARLNRPYRSEVLEGPCLAEFHTRAYRLVEDGLKRFPSRHCVKGSVLLLSIALAFVLWGLFFGWGLALALAVIILVHESGHAVTMRAFGYRNMSMFFLPMLGAVVTGSARDLAAWKQALVLLAGPVPGLVVGLGMLAYLSAHPGQVSGFDWQLVAVIAVYVNLFNLLPVTPLDGGQLVELALFSRWPIARLGFAVLSILAFFTLALWLAHSPVLWVLVALLVWTLRGQWRVVRLQRAWQDGLGEEEQLNRLFDAARQGFGAQPFIRLYGLVKGVFLRRSIRRPQLWESAAVVLLMAGLWSGVAAVVYQQTSRYEVSAPVADPRSAAQIAFDDTYDAYYDTENDAKEDALLKQLERLSQDLAQDDPRRVDLAAQKAWGLSGPEQRKALETLLAEGREGFMTSLADIAQDLLWDVYGEAAEQGPEQRAALIHAAAARIEQLAPSAFPGTIPARLREAEALDQAGDTARAQTLLLALRERALDLADEERWRADEVIRAQAWLRIAQGQAKEAVTLLEAAPDGQRIMRGKDALARDYAWALLEAGRTQEGLERMRVASHGRPYVPSMVDRLLGRRNRPAPLRDPLDLAAALIRAGRTAEAKGLLDQRSQWSCMRASEEYNEHVPSDPWQRGRDQELHRVAKAICPPSALHAKPGDLQCRDQK